MPNKLSQFWQELKRRNVVRVITVYAGATFVILELVDIIAEPLRLPSWLLPVAIVLLSIGFIIAIILSWIYDLHPDGGMVKTEPFEKVKAEEIPRPSNNWKIASYVSFVVILGLIVFNIIPRISRTEDHAVTEKSIAVLPFNFYSPNNEADDIGDAFANEIITQLYKIRGFDRIISHTSTLQYKGINKPSIPEIGEALNANYIIEGSLERQNQNFSFHVQVIESLSDNLLWAEKYSGNWEEIFSIRAKIVKGVASELKTILTPYEIEQLDKRPTENLDAYDLYLLGNQYRDLRTEETFLRSVDLYESAIRLDPNFALAYVGLSNSYSELFWHANWLPRIAYEKARIAVLNALEIDPDLAVAHRRYATLLNAIEYDPNSDDYKDYYGIILHNLGRTDSSIIYLSNRIKEDPESVTPHYFLGYIYCSTGDYDKAIVELEKAVNLDSISQPYRCYLGIAYARAGMPEKTRMQLWEFEKLDQYERTVSCGRAALLAELGEVDSALYWLQKACEERYYYLLFLRTYPVMFAPIRSEPRFMDIYNKICRRNESPLFIECFIIQEVLA